MNDTVYYISEASKKVEVEPHVLRYWEDELKLPIGRNEMGHRCYTEKDIETLRRIRQLKEQGLQLRAIRVVLQGGGQELYSRKYMPDGVLCGAAVKAASGGAGIGAMDGGTGVKTASGGAGIGAVNGGTGVKAASDDTGIKDVYAGIEARAVDGGAQRKESEAAGGKGRQPDQGTAEHSDLKGNPVEEKLEDMIMKKAKKYMVTMSKGKETVLEMPEEGRELREYEEPLDEEKEKKAKRLQYLLQHMVTDAVKSANREMCTEIKESILKELDYQFRQQEERDEERKKREEEHYRRIDEMISQRRRPSERFGRGKKKEPLP